MPVRRTVGSRRLYLLAGMVALRTVALASPATAQFADRARLDWRTVETSHFRFIYPQPLSAWALPVAAHFEAVRGAVDGLVGSSPASRVTVVMDDPMTLSNGLTNPELRAPTILFLATPPGPRSEIGDNRGWGEILSVHEYAHAAHLTRPSRNPLSHWLEELPLLPTDIGPLARRSPRWVIEGYATYVEGKLTGSGRPHGVWRAAVLREWALEGKLPSYGAMSGASGYRGGSFAYLAGSAYLEWLVAQRGDSALPRLWRRQSARQRRSFGEAFAGVFGGSPVDLYDRFRVETTERAVEARRALAASGLSVGDTIQSLSWQTGDPAVSGDGRHIVIVLRSENAPSRVVVWNVAPEPDTGYARRLARMLARDPEDVAPIRWQPPPKRALATLWPAAGGRSYDNPRFLPDGEHILLTRFETLGNGSRRPDLVVWDWRHGGVRRITHGGAIVSADPAPDGRSAVAIRCLWGRCDLVRVELANGKLTMIAAGSPERVWSRPRFSHDGSRIVAARQSGGRWSPVLVDARTGVVTPAGPEDGAQRYDPSFLPGDTALVVTSELGGIPNLEVLELATGATRPITRVTGAAMAPEPEPGGGILFLRLHSSGLDLARVRSNAGVGLVVAIDSALAPVAPLPLSAGRQFPATALPGTRAYRLGPRQYRLIPSIGLAGSGVAGRIALASSDPVGRLGWLAQGTFGSLAWSGGSLRAVYRGIRPQPELDAFSTAYRPRPTDARGDSTGLPDRVRYRGLGGALDLRLPGSSSSLWFRMGGALGRLQANGRHLDRPLGWFDVHESLQTASGAGSAGVSLGVSGSAGRTGGAAWNRQVGFASVAVHPAAGPELQLRTMAGLVRGGGLLERFTVGGEEPPLYEPMLTSQQIAMPALNDAALVGRRLVTTQVRLGAAGGWLYGWLGHADQTVGWQRVVGAEQELDTDPIPLLRVPGVRAVLGAGYTLDEKPHRQLRLYGTATLRP